MHLKEFQDGNEREESIEELLKIWRKTQVLGRYICNLEHSFWLEYLFAWDSSLENSFSYLSHFGLKCCFSNLLV